MTILRSWCICFSSLLAAQATAREAGDRDARANYLRFCAPCHGERGDGGGPLAAQFDPRPRDFTSGIYKFRTTASGTLPLASDLRRTIDEGLRGTAMPGWRAVLAPAERDALVNYLQSLSPRFASDSPGEVVSVPAAPRRDEKTLSRGRHSYERMRCGECHGPDGRGDGPSAKTLRDDRGARIRMPDLTRITGQKRVSSERDVVVTFLTGLDGTPMPSYREAVSPSEVWDLARYVRSWGRAPRLWERILLQEPLTWNQ